MYYTKIAISVHGSSAHGSTPHLGKDAIVAASAIILNAQTLVSRVNNPLKPLVLTFSGVNGGTQFNIITDLVQMTAYLYAEAKEDLTAMQHYYRFGADDGVFICRSQRRFNGNAAAACCDL